MRVGGELECLAMDMGMGWLDNSRREARHVIACDALTVDFIEHRVSAHLHHLFTHLVLKLQREDHAHVIKLRLGIAQVCQRIRVADVCTLDVVDAVLRGERCEGKNGVRTNSRKRRWQVS